MIIKTLVRKCFKIELVKIKWYALIKLVQVNNWLIYLNQEIKIWVKLIKVNKFVNKIY